MCRDVKLDVSDCCCYLPGCASVPLLYNHKRGISQESGNEIPVFVFPSVVVPMFKLCFSIIVYVPFAVLLLLLILHTRKSSGLKLTHLPRTYISQDS